MITQKDIHNIIVKSDIKIKLWVVTHCNYDIEKIKEFESTMAKFCNEGAKKVSEVSDYMHTKI